MENIHSPILSAKEQETEMVRLANDNNMPALAIVAEWHKSDENPTEYIKWWPIVK